ncbi:MAG: inositol monophosphatase [Candidatus Gastranaerophilales bacterium]|nr:inositol monophosphatase [Candidatus Gastranaerophilales bacterium]
MGNNYVEDTEKLLEVAKEAANEAGEIQLSFIGKKKNIEYKSNRYDLVTEADRECEAKIIEIIKAAFPDHNVLGEESGEHKESTSPYTWIIDPIDGTTNFAHNFPHFATSIGLMKDKKLILGVVYDASKNELFWAGEDTGAFLNSNPIQVSDISTLEGALLATGFAPSNPKCVEENAMYLMEFLRKGQPFRRPGAASLDICYVACGRMDGFWELNLSPWDMAAGAYIIKAAGGTVTNFDSEDFDPYIRSIIATNGLLHKPIQDVINHCRKKVC